MESLIYFPTFEPPSESWLKFSLLYFENFSPIIPHSHREDVSDNFRRVRDNTDLITIYSPEYTQGYRASVRAIEEAEKIRTEPYSRSYLFREVNILRKWQNPANWTFELCREKFSDEWLQYCQNHNIGVRTNNGVRIPEELAFLFMTQLAKEIAFNEHAAIITDENKFDNYTNFTRVTTPIIERRNRFAKAIINLLVPQDLNRISIQRLIDFRNRNRPLIKALNSELDNVQLRIANGYSEQDFVNSYNNIYSEFSREVLLLGFGVAAIPFAAYLLITNSMATTPEYAKEILGALGIIFGGGYALNKALVDNETKRYCKKYFTNLKRLRS
jgi:hypothetical protein